jgi:predicted flap endonuclease-1-like 5' DNA nuclease
VLDAFQDAFGTLAQDEARGVRAWLLRWIGEHPLHHFCFVREQVCALDADEPVGAAALSELLFWLVQDSRNAFLSRACHECGPGSAVPLARVWLTPPHGNVPDCHVAGIDPYWPYRRDLAHAAYPAPRGAVNLGQLIWHRREEACVRLADLGVEITGVTKFEPPEDLTELRALLACDPFAACDAPRRMLVHDAAAFGERVVGFCSLTARPSIRLEKRSDVSEGLVGSGVEFTFSVTNTGDEDFVVSVDDDQLGFIGTDTVAAGATREFTKPWTVPSTRGTVTNVATATAKGPGGSSAVRADHRFTVLNGEPDTADGGRELRLVPGIGPAREALLKRNGVRGLAQLAEAETERISAILGGGLAPDVIERWRAQARELLAR